MKIYKGETQLKFRWSRLWWFQGAYCFSYTWMGTGIYDDYVRQHGREPPQWRWIWKKDWAKYGIK